MKKVLWSALALGLLILIVGLAGCNEGTSRVGSIFNNQSTGIWVSGQGKVTAAPDMAVLSLGVQAQAATVEQAQGQAAASMNAVISALKTGGIADKDIRTTAFSIQQLTRYDDKTQQQVVLGYLVTNTVTAKIRNVASAGTIIDAAAKAGGDNTRINSIGFTIDDPTPFETQARQLAVDNARAKATQLATQAGVKLGEPTYINESGGFVPLPSLPVKADASAPSTPISPGTMDIMVNVQVTYEID